MYSARGNFLKQIHDSDSINDDHETHARRMFAEVIHLTTRDNGFISGTARFGRSQIMFDSYSFQAAKAGIHLGPFFLEPYTGAAPLNRQSYGQGGAAGPRSAGTMLYGTVIQQEQDNGATSLRFLDVVVADELFFFWSTLQRGRSFVHANRHRYFLKNGGGEMYAAACVLVSDAHTLMHTCLPEDKRPPKYINLRLRTDPVSFVLLLSMVCNSSEPFRLFSAVLRSRKSTVQPHFMRQLDYMVPCTREQAERIVRDDATFDLGAFEEEASKGKTRPIIPACVRYVVQTQFERVTSIIAANQLDQEGGGGDDDDESEGVLSDDEHIQQNAEAFDQKGAFVESEGSISDF